MTRWHELIVECGCISMGVRVAAHDLPFLGSAQEQLLFRNDGRGGGEWHKPEIADEPLREVVQGEFTWIGGFVSSDPIVDFLSVSSNPWPLRNPRAYYGAKVMGKARQLKAASMIVALRRADRWLVVAETERLLALATHALQASKFDKDHLTALRELDVRV